MSAKTEITKPLRTLRSVPGIARRNELINKAVALSGLPKQEYCYRRCLNQEIVVQGNPRVYKALRKELAEVLTELKRIETGNSVDEELLNVIELITIILGGLKGENENGK